MNEKFEKVMVIIILAVFAFGLITSTVFKILDKEVPGLYSFSLSGCAILLLITRIKCGEKQIASIILLSLAAVAGMISGILQII